MRLQSFLSRAGVASRRSVVGELEAGKVKVNGEVVRVPSHPVFPDRDKITYLDKPVQLAEKKYYLFYKPAGVISTAKDTHGRKTVLDYFKDEPERIYPVGRLDQDTTGLLLLTNDGDLALQLTHPRYGVKKVYEAILSRQVSGEEIRKLERGVILQDGKTAPCEIKILKNLLQKSRLPERFDFAKLPARSGAKSLTSTGDSVSPARQESPARSVAEARRTFSKVQVMLHEGRKRQIRLMFQSIGIRVLDLHRAFYGPLSLKGLRPGERRPLSLSELALLKKSILNPSHMRGKK